MFFESYGIDSLYSVSLPGYAYEYNLYEKKQDVKYIHVKKQHFVIGKRSGRGLFGVHGPR